MSHFHSHPNANASGLHFENHHYDSRITKDNKLQPTMDDTLHSELEKDEVRFARGETVETAVEVEAAENEVFTSKLSEGERHKPSIKENPIKHKVIVKHGSTEQDPDRRRREKVEHQKEKDEHLLQEVYRQKLREHDAGSRHHDESRSFKEEAKMDTSNDVKAAVKEYINKLSHAKGEKVETNKSQQTEEASLLHRVADAALNLAGQAKNMISQNHNKEDEEGQQDVEQHTGNKESILSPGSATTHQKKKNIAIARQRNDLGQEKAELLAQYPDISATSTQEKSVSTGIPTSEPGNNPSLIDRVGGMLSNLRGRMGLDLDSENTDSSNASKLTSTSNTENPPASASSVKS